MKLDKKFRRSFHQFLGDLLLDVIDGEVTDLRAIAKSLRWMADECDRQANQP